MSERREAGTPPSSERGPSAPAPLLPETLLDEAEIRECVDRLAGEISADHPDGVVLVGVLKGASIFLADLARAIRTIDVEVDFIADDPGPSLLHCHHQDHQDEGFMGMMTYI